MCTVCGCSNHEMKIEGSGEHEHSHADGTVHSHRGADHHRHDLHYGLGPARTHAAGMSQTRMVKVEQNILAKNDAYAGANRDYFRKHGIFTLNLVSSPGSGKTTLLVRTVNALKERYPISVIEGDQQTTLDADRIRATGIPRCRSTPGAAVTWMRTWSGMRWNGCSPRITACC